MLPVTRRNFHRLHAALRDALPSLEKLAVAEDVQNAQKKARGYPVSTVARGIYESARDALAEPD